MQSNTIVEIKKILNRVRKYLISEGGDVEFVKYEDGIVYVSMMGACLECAGMDITLKEGIERFIIEQIPEVIEVRHIPKEV